MAKNNMGKETEIKPNFKVYIPTGEDIAMAGVVSDWTKGENMLPKTCEEILSLFRFGNSVLIKNEKGILISHAGITFTYDDNWKEIGAVATNKDFRRIGAASTAVKELMKTALKKEPKSKFFALANNLSAGLFKKLGGKRMLSTELPSGVWTLCKSCPNYKTPEEGLIFRCCDTPYNLIDII